MLPLQLIRLRLRGVAVSLAFACPVHPPARHDRGSRASSTLFAILFCVVVLLFMGSCCSGVRRAHLLGGAPPAAILVPADRRGDP